MREGMRPAEDEVVKRAMSEVPPMSDAAFAAGRTALLARIEGTEPAEVVSIDTARRKHRRIPWLVAAAAMVLVVAGALVGPSLLPNRDGAPQIGSAVAAQLLDRAAAAAGDATLQPGQYLYVRQRADWASSGENPPVWMYRQDQLLETWVPADRTQEWLHRRTTTGTKQWLKGSEADLPPDLPPMQVLGEWKAKGGLFYGVAQVSFIKPTPAYLAALPRDPKALYEKLRGEASEERLLLTVTAGLDTGLIPADLRAAVYQALRYLPNLQVIDNAADLDGRQGAALGVTLNEHSNQIVLDPATGEYLGSRTVLVSDLAGIPAGTEIGNTSVTTKVVNGLGQTS